MFQHWYHFPELGESVFAPSKFIGYQDTTLSGYVGHGGGGQTEKRLERWFRKCDRDSRSYEVLYTRLKNHSNKIEREVNKAISGGKGGIHVIDNLYPDEAQATTLKEGRWKKVTVNEYERSKKARMKCISKYGYKCHACKKSLDEVYGEIGKDFVHVHHLVQISKIGHDYEVDPIQDLCPVCPNCHAMLHRTDPPLTP